MNVNTIIDDMIVLINAANAVRSNRTRFISIMGRVFAIADMNRDTLIEADSELVDKIDKLHTEFQWRIDNHLEF